MSTENITAEIIEKQKENENENKNESSEEDKLIDRTRW